VAFKEVLVVLCVLLTAFSGCTTYREGNVGGEDDVKEMHLEIVNITTDKDVYHSNEIMGIGVILYSSKDADDVNVRCRGIEGRLNEERVVNLSAGRNHISFEFRLPRCNVCGGIREGIYRFECMVSWGDTEENSSVYVEIRQ